MVSSYSSMICWYWIGSVSAIIENKDLSLYENERKVLNKLLLTKGTIEKFNIKKVKYLLTKSMSLMTYVDSVHYVK